ncbi:uncharacterized protein LOC116616085 [Nematostella vectensis]|uniref:uncharacterized protein LOC116616085 n=1 Tax=Nematostella vectensis TaxID=45351 RepID=UPI0013905DBD|nr:uncharacterized protein LOC116616085 [Nematostella vectensis]
MALTDGREVFVFDDDEVMQFWDAEFVKSNLITLASCDGAGESGCPGKDTPCTDKDTTSQGDKSPKPRKFRKLPLPHWLTKPHRKPQDSESKASTSKKRMTRANSAPKTLGHNRLSLEKHHQEKISEEPLEEPQRKSSANLLSPKPWLTNKRGDKDGLLRRRASLPSNVGHAYHDLRRSPNPDKPLTPKLERKTAADNGEKLEKDVVKALLFSKPHTKYLAKQVPRQDSITEEVPQEYRLQQPVPKLQLHCLDTPDMFFVPVIDEEGQDNGQDNMGRQLSASADELHVATRVEPEEDENEAIQAIIARELQTYLQEKEFEAVACQQWCLDLSQNMRTAVQGYKVEECKVVAVVYIGAMRGSGVHAAVQSMLTPFDDNLACADYKNQSLYAFASILVTRLE